MFIKKYYKVVFHSDVYIFKLKEIRGNKLFVDCNFYIMNNMYCDFKNERHIPYFNNKVYEEIDIKDIIDLLPEDNVDKIIYFRKHKINRLLNDTIKRK